MRGFGEGPEQCAKEVQVRTPNTLERMEKRCQQLEEELSATTEAIEILKKNPDVARLLTLMGRINF